MKPYYADDWLTVYHGDARAVMAEMEPESINCVVTSPPYWGLRDYGEPGQLGLEPTPEAYVAALVDVFREVRRVLRADGTVWLNLGDCYAVNGGARTYGSTDGAVGRGDAPGGPRRAPAGIKAKDLVGVPWMVAFALRADGWYLRSDIIWAKGRSFDPTGSGAIMPEAVRDRPSRAHEYLFLLSRSARYHYDAEAAREASDPAQEQHNRRYAKVYDAHSATVGGGRAQPGNVNNIGLHSRPGDGGRNLRSVWVIQNESSPVGHPAAFPTRLVEPCILAGCPEGGVVLDPFAGSGTTGLVAQRLSRRAILIDLSMDYLGQLMDRNRDIPLGLTS